MHINDCSADSLSCKHLCSIKCISYLETCCYDGNITSVKKLNALADLELVITVVIDDRHCKTSESEIYRSLKFVSSLNCSLCFDIICRADNGHAGDHTHESKILVALMRSTVLTNRDTGMSSADLNIKLRVSDGVPYLLVSSACSEHCEGACERYVSAG